MARAKQEYRARFNRGGNTKLGKTMGTWSVLMGDDFYYIPELNETIQGTCGQHCQGCKGSCYVVKSYVRHTNAETGECSVKYGHARNTRALRENVEKVHDQLAAQLQRARVPFTVIRLNQSGEIENAMQFGMFCRLAREFDDVEFYIYTKAFDVVVPMLLAGLVPGNLTVLISVWHEYGQEAWEAVKHLPNVKAFVYNDGYDYVADGLKFTTKCEAYHGRKLNHACTCDVCKKCFDRIDGHKVIACDAH